MPDETPHEPSGWQIMRLMDERDRLYLERRHADRDQIAAMIIAVKEASQAAFAAAKESAAKADLASEKRLDSFNVSRAQLSDQAATFLTRAEFEAHHTALTNATAELAARLEQFGGRQTGLSDARGVTIAAVGILIGLSGVITSIIIAVTR